MFALLALLEVSEETISSPLVVVLTNLVCKMAGALWSFFPFFSTGRLVWLFMSWSSPCPSPTLDVLLPLCCAGPLCVFTSKTPGSKQDYQCRNLKELVIPLALHG